MELREIPKPGDYNKMSNESRRAYDFIKASQMGLAQPMRKNCKTQSRPTTQTPFLTQKRHRSVIPVIFFYKSLIRS